MFADIITTLNRNYTDNIKVFKKTIIQIIGLTY